MITYKNSYFPGPTSVADEVLKKGLVNYGSADVEVDFLELYKHAVEGLQTVYNSKSDVIILTGEGMLALWGALKSCLVKGDKVLCLSTGLFGSGTKPMAESIGCEVKLVEFGYDDTFSDYNVIEDAIRTFKPKMITAVQCETPSGIMNDLSVIGKLKKQYDVPLLYVDSVAALGGYPVNADDNNIDLCLGGSQKALSVPPNSCFTTVSEKAWNIIDKVDYHGYDAFKDFRKVKETGYFPYTPSWVNVAQLAASVDSLIHEGLDNVFKRHEECAKRVRKCLKDKGIKLFPKDESFSASTVTAAYIPEGYTWQQWDKHLRDKGLVCGGNYGPLADKVFRIGHMGTQAQLANVEHLCGLL